MDTSWLTDTLDIMSAVEFLSVSMLTRNRFLEALPGKVDHSCTSLRPPAMEYLALHTPMEQNSLVWCVQSEVTIEKENKNIEFCYMQVLLP